MARPLNDIDPGQLDALCEKFGKPKDLHFAAEFLDYECDLVKQSTAKGRHHDITCFIRCDDQWVVIQKHNYAETGIFRAPSGGAHTGESLEEAALREMYEETGLEIKLTRFILDLSLDVKCLDGTVIPWRSLVFLADTIGGEMQEIDTHEVYKVRLMTREELLGDVDELMKNSGWGGFSYRSFLTRSFFEELDRLELF
ncbi:MAG: NUDIX hydrolase [Candidatus Thorarchaeota archaeon]|nr:MAG: NUDIX hydrolase [Candidatus Thorarchaeota archaeon]